MDRVVNRALRLDDMNKYNCDFNTDFMFGLQVHRFKFELIKLVYQGTLRDPSHRRAFYILPPKPQLMIGRNEEMLHIVNTL